MPPKQHPGNDYYVNVVTHTIQQQSNPLLGHAMLAAGYVGPFDWANAQAAVIGAKFEAGNAAGTAGALGTVQNAAGAASGAVSNLGGLSAIGDFFNRLTQSNTWLRVGEVVVGVLILYIGLKATTAQTPVGNAVKSATAPVKKAARVAGEAAIAA